MMFGTVMMSNSTPSNTTESTSIASTLTKHQQQQVTSVSHTVSSKSYHEYMSTDSDALGAERYKVPKPTTEPPSLKASLNSTENSTANNLRKQQSHQTQRQVSERSVNFGEMASENEYAKIKLEKRQAKRENRENKRRLDAEKSGVDQVEVDSKIQVQILPQDDNWGENTTAFTADFSDFNDDMTEDGRSGRFDFGGGGGGGKQEGGRMANMNFKESKEGRMRLMSKCRFYCASYFGLVCALMVSVCAFVTPILFVLLPRMNLWQINECGLECESQLVGIAFKLFILLIGAWALFARKPRASQLPRVYELRTLLLLLLTLLTFSYWLFYAVRIVEARTPDYYEILNFTGTYVDIFLFIFIISVFALELRPLKCEYVVRIVRSPDGATKEYNLGGMSIQRAAVCLLEHYYKDFTVYNPWLENNQRKRGAQLLKMEQAASKRGAGGRNSGRNGSVYGGEDDNEDAKSVRSRMETASMVGGNLNANDRFYEEYEYERRLRKRRARLITTTEEAFTHVRRIQGETSAVPDENGLVPAVMDPFETAQAVFTSIARDLRRYLRVTRQQPYFTRESIVAHLANCISYDMSPKAFLQRYLSAEPLIFNERALVSASSQQHRTLNGIGAHGVNYHLNMKTRNQAWILICDTPLYQSCEDNLMFVLKQNEVSLMCSFKRLPRFSLIEDILDPSRNKFVIKFNSETTV